MNPQVADFLTYNTNKRKDCLEPQDYGLPSNDFRHLKVLDFLDENGVKTVESLKDELGYANLNFLSHSRPGMIRMRIGQPQPQLNQLVKNDHNHNLT